MGFIRELLGGIVELICDVTTQYYDSGKAQKHYDALSKQIDSLHETSSNQEERQRLAEMQAKREKLGKAINDYDTRFRNNPEAYDKLDNIIDKIKGR